MEEILIKSPFIPLFQRGKQQVTNTLTRRTIILVGNSKAHVAAWFGRGDPSIESHPNNLYGAGLEPAPTEDPTSLVNQNRDIVAALIRHGQIYLAVAIEIPDRNGDRGCPHGKVCGRSERACACANQD